MTMEGRTATVSWTEPPDDSGIATYVVSENTFGLRAETDATTVTLTIPGDTPAALRFSVYAVDGAGNEGARNYTYADVGVAPRCEPLASDAPSRWSIVHRTPTALYSGTPYVPTSTVSIYHADGSTTSVELPEPLLLQPTRVRDLTAARRGDDSHVLVDLDTGALTELPDPVATLPRFSIWHDDALIDVHVDRLVPTRSTPARRPSWPKVPLTPRGSWVTGSTSWPAAARTACGRPPYEGCLRRAAGPRTSSQLPAM